MELHSVDDNLENGMEGSSQSEQLSLIPGLPDDIALSCLARVPRKDHSLLNCVLKGWRVLVSSEEWFSYRLKHHLEETWIYALCRDKSEQHRVYMLDPNHLKSGWKRIHGFPNCCLKRRGMGFEALGSKLYLFGGCGWIEDATSEVYCYDALTNMWSTAASYPLQDPNVIPEVEDSLVLDGKIYVRYVKSAISSPASVVVYEPSNGTWKQAEADMVSGWRSPAVVILPTCGYWQENICYREGT